MGLIRGADGTSDHAVEETHDRCWQAKAGIALEAFTDNRPSRRGPSGCSGRGTGPARGRGVSGSASLSTRAGAVPRRPARLPSHWDDASPRERQVLGRSGCVGRVRRDASRAVAPCVRPDGAASRQPKRSLPFTALDPLLASVLHAASPRGLGFNQFALRILSAQKTKATTDVQYC